MKLPSQHADHFILNYILNEIRNGELIDGARLGQGKPWRTAEFERRDPDVAVETTITAGRRLQSSLDE